MALIMVPKAKGVINPDRPVNALLKAQVQHLQEAERVLPLKYHSDIYIRAIKTEGEAAEYIQQVTDAIHRAHKDAVTRRMAKKGVISIAAVADEGAEREPRDIAKNSAKKRTSKKKSVNKKGKR